MSIYISVDEISAITESVNKQSKALEEKLRQLEERLNHFTQDETQKAQSWECMRSHLSDYILIVSSLSSAFQKIESDCDELESGVRDGISPDTVLDEEQLNLTIGSLEMMNASLASSMSCCDNLLTIPSLKQSVNNRSVLHNNITVYQKQINGNNKKISDCRDKIRKLRNVERKTCRYLTEIRSLFEASLTGIKSVTAAYQAEGNTFIIDNKSDWKNKLYTTYAQALYTDKERQKLLRQGFTDEDLYMKTACDYRIEFENTSVAEEFLEELWGVDTPLYLNGMIKNLVDRNQDISLLRNGVRFTLTKSPKGKILLKMSGSAVTTRTRAQLQQFLSENISDVQWKKYDVKQLTRGGLGLNSDELKAPHVKETYKPLGDALEEVTGSRVSAVGSFKNGAKNDIKTHFENITEWKGATKLEKTSKALGIAGDLFTIGIEGYDNLWDSEEKKLVINPHSVTETVADVGVDFLANAGFAGAGSAIGSAFLPPLGTVVGAAAGYGIGILANVDFVDVNHDGEKDSFMDILHIGVDYLCDFVWGDD